MDTMDDFARRCEPNRWTRFCSKLRMAEDMLQRALDQLEDMGDDSPVAYVRKQVDKAHDEVIDCNATILAFGQ